MRDKEKASMPREVEASVEMCSVVVTGEANGLSPRKYVQWLL